MILKRVNVTWGNHSTPMLGNSSFLKNLRNQF